MEEKIVEATIEHVKTLTDFVNEKLEVYSAPMEVQFQLAIVIDEIFNNIVSYAYPNKNGKARLSIDIDEKTKLLKLVFVDSGVPFNPLEQNEPDISAKAEQRKIGGLGIFVVKKMMDRINYCRKDDQNILSLEMVWPYKLKQEK